MQSQGQEECKGRVTPCFLFCYADILASGGMDKTATSINARPHSPLLAPATLREPYRTPQVPNTLPSNLYI